uniref:Oleate-activated transcription factor 1 n=1 Tax=Talaromyces marneffei PM1 TaxID=1077442 RepID=A0A093VF75_TALMA
MASLNPSGEHQTQTQVTSSQLKRTTCNLCRERKVRCDREKPQCHRCRKSGLTCVYPSDKTDSDEIKSALNLLHSRLLQAETKLQEQGLRFTTQSTKPNSALSPSYTSQDSQFVYDPLSQGDGMDYSNLVFSESDPRYNFSMIRSKELYPGLIAASLATTISCPP